MSFYLQMMPGGMTPASGYWGAGWIPLTLTILVGVIAITVLLAFFLRRDNPQPAPDKSFLRSVGPQAGKAESSHRIIESGRIEILGKVVKSLGPTLMDDERRVMDEIVKAGGEVLQSDLPRLTGFSKATVSKAVHGLEVRAIIVREKHKWTYWCKVNQRLIDRTLQEQVALEKPTTSAEQRA